MSYGYADPEKDDDPPPASGTTRPHKVYPEVPLVYPGRPVFCTGCCDYDAYMFKKHGNGHGFKVRPPIPGESDCELHKGRRQDRIAELRGQQGGAR